MSSRLKTQINTRKNRGFSLLELVIAIAIFAFGSFAMGAMLIDSSVSTNISIERTEALFYAKEGLEAVRSIRDNDWNTVSALTDGNHGITISSSTWNFNNVADTLNTKFTRTIYISASSTASFLKNVAVTVDWPLQSGKLATTTLNTIVTNWINVRNLPSQIPTDGLVSYWSFDDALSGTAVDSVGTSTGTVYGATSTPGVRSYGYSFDATNDYIDAGVNPNLAIAGTISISVWVKFNSVSQTNQTMVAKNGSSNNGYWLFYNFASSNNQKFDFFGVNNANAYSNTGPVENEWTHVVAIRDETNVTYYIDGVFDVTVAVGGTVNPVSNNSLTFGSRSEGGGSSYLLNGSIDQVRIYNRALTPYEVGVIYSEEKP
jgi:prepilin-type N-terminal cleavage/methylation domain-containing protein